MNPMNPLQATREAPVHFTIRDCLVGAWIARDDDPATADPRGLNHSSWTIDVGGHEHRGPAVDAARHGSSDGVKDMLRSWAKEHAELFD
jgi:hypothetical protein